MYLCSNKKKSPSVGVPVCVTDEALEKENFPKELRGGVIIEDLTMVDKKGLIHRIYRVKHRFETKLWLQSELIEIGGMAFPVDEEDKG
jgi:hypothetical protein